MNTAKGAQARKPILMAQAMQKVVESGRQAYLAGRMTKTPLASASSPEKGLIK